MFTIKQSTFGEIIESEKELIIKAQDIYGDFFINAFEFCSLIGKFIKSVDDIEKYLFVAFLSQVKNYHTLALFSSARMHHVQAGMNLRQVLEAGSWAAYALGNKEQEKFCISDQCGEIEIPDRLENAKNMWLEQNFKAGSDFIKNFKKTINKSTAHAKIFNTFQSFSFERDKFNTPFFDNHDDLLTKTDFWSISNVALGLLDLFYGINKQYKVFQFEDYFDQKFKYLSEENYVLKEELMRHPRLNKFF